MVKLFKDIARRLDKVTPDAFFEAGIIFETVLGRDWRKAELCGELTISDAQEKAINLLAEKRLSGLPLQYAVGEWEFWGIPLKIREGALIPRQDTETLVETALSLIKNLSSPRVIDLCSGTGCVALAIKKERPDADVTAVEKYPEAYSVLCENAKMYRDVYPIEPVLGDALSDEFAAGISGVDLITANPPYLTESDMQNLQTELEYEPETALFGGGDGLRFYRELPKIWRGSLKDGGHIAFEIGLGQHEAVIGLLCEAKFYGVNVKNDLTGRQRVVYGAK